MFKKKFETARDEKQSLLCVGLDPRGVEDILNFCLDIIESVSEFCIAVKPNTQFLLPLGMEEIIEINEKAHSHGLLSILDHKLSDIGSSNRQAVFWISEMGFDAFTFSPFSGNFETLKFAEEKNLGVFTLTLMSNPEAKYFMKTRINGIPGYEFVSRKVLEHGGEGIVVGATCEKSDLVRIKNIVHDEVVVLSPGVGAQGGGLDVLKIFGKNTLINISRGIISAENPKTEAKKYCEMIDRVISWK